MTVFNSEGVHEYYTSTDRHWHPKSEGAYTGADSLLTAQRNGWQLVGLAYRQDLLFGAGRRSTLYHFELIRGDETIIMPIVSNPFITKLLRTHRIDILPYRRSIRQRANTDDLLTDSA